MVKKTTVARVLPASTASTESPSRSRVVDRSFTSFCRFTQPSRDTMTTLSSSTMKSSAEYSTLVRVRGDERARLSVFVGVRLLDLLELVADQRPAASSSLQQAADLRARLRLSASSFVDDEDLEPGQAIELQLENRVGLLGVELEPLHDLLRRVGLAVGLADDADDLVERVEDLLEALEDVDPLLQRAELVLEARGDDVEPEVQEVPEDLLQVQPLGPADLRVLRRDEAGQVDGDVGLQRRVLARDTPSPASGSASFLISSSMRTSSVETSRTSTSGGSLRPMHDLGDALDQRAPC